MLSQSNKHHPAAIRQTPNMYLSPQKIVPQKCAIYSYLNNDYIKLLAKLFLEIIEPFIK